MQRDEISERDYWGLRAAEAGRAIGADWTVRDLVGRLETDEHEFVRPEAVATLRAAAAARVPVVVLTNDLAAFHGRNWFATLAVASHFDAVVDGSITGILKPDPRAYALALESIGLAAHEALFVDDQPRNAAGAEVAGLVTQLFDVTQPAAAFERVLRTIAQPAGA
jgi:putative hydrolase of the HAD superfamily